VRQALTGPVAFAHNRQLSSNDYKQAAPAVKDVQASSMGRCEGEALVRMLPKQGRVLERMGGQSAFGKHSPKLSTCAVVGNSGSLQATKFGRGINLHEAVIRLNQAPTAGYEDIVGNKTTFRIINKEWVAKYSSGLKWLPLEEGLSLVSRGDGEKRIGRGKYVCALCTAETKSKMKRWSSKKHVAVLQLSSMTSKAAWAMLSRYSRCSQASNGKCPQCKPSSGILAVSLALSLCNNVSVYGMAGTRFPGEFPYHYYKFHGTELKMGYSGHMFNIETELLSFLGRQGILTVCSADSATDCHAEGSMADPCCNPQTAPNNASDMAEPENNPGGKADGQQGKPWYQGLVPRLAGE